MTALHLHPLDPVCHIGAPGCARAQAASQPGAHEAEPDVPVAPGEPLRPLDLSPVSAYEIVTRQMIEATQRDVAEIKGRINNLMVMVCGAVLVNIVLRIAGLG